MHFKREQTINGVEFVAIPKAWLESTVQYLCNQPVIEVAEILNESTQFVDVDSLSTSEKSS
jgi:hypothetical protein